MKRILIVDDEPDILAALTWVFHSKYIVVTERESRKVMQLIEKGNFNLLITDIRMSNVDGWELIQAVHKIKPKLPIVVMSIYLDEVERIKTSNGEICGFLQKPFLHDEVEEMVERILEESGSSKRQ